MTIILSKKLVAVLAVATLATASWKATADSANPQSIAINFTGKVVDNTCATASVDNGNTVRFGSISLANFTGVGSVGKTVPFTITFSDCGVSAMAQIYFSGTTTNAIGAVDNKVNATAGTTRLVGIDPYSRNIGVQIWDGVYQLRSDDITATVSPYFSLSGSAPRQRTLMAKVVQTTDSPPTLGGLDASGTLFVVYE